MNKTCYRVVGWDEYFENNRTREMKTMSWVPVPNKHDGDGYTELLDHPNGAAHLGAWLAIVQVASKCATRGTLLRDTAGRSASSCGPPPRPHDSTSLARITRIPAAIFDEAIPRLCEIGWLELIDCEAASPAAAGENATPNTATGCKIPQEGAAKPQAPAEHSTPSPQEGAPRVRAKNGTERNRREGKGREKKARVQGRGSPPPPPDDFWQQLENFVALWNSTEGTQKVHSIDELGDKHRLIDLFGNPAWKLNHLKALQKFPLPYFEADGGMHVLWFLEHGAVEKILAGKYNFVPRDRQPISRAPSDMSHLQNLEAFAHEKC